MVKQNCDLRLLTEKEKGESAATASGGDGNKPCVEEAEVGLKRQVRLISLIAYLVGSIIGAGIFATSKSVAMNVDSTGGILLVWVGGGAIAMMGSLTWCELGGMFPNSCGNKYTYISEAFGDLLGFVYIFLMMIVAPIGLALISLVAGNYVMIAIVGQDESSNYPKLVAAIIIVINTIVNCIGVKWGEWTQILFTSLKLGAIAMIIVTGLVRLGQGHSENFQDAFNGSTPTISNIGYALYGSMYSYGGWENLGFLSAEAVDPINHPPIATFVGIPLVIICYLTVNVAYLTVLTPSELAVSDAVAVTIAKRYYGVMHWIIPVLVGCSCFGTANSKLFFQGRMLFEGANRGQFPQIFGTVHIRHHTPIPSLIFIAVTGLIVLIPKSSTFVSLLNIISGMVWTMNALAVAAMLWMRRSRPNAERPFKVFVLIPIILFIISIFLVIAPFYSHPVKSSYGMIVILIAIPLYFAFIKYQILPERALQKYHLATQKIQSWCNLSLPDSGRPDCKELEINS